MRRLGIIAPLLAALLTPSAAIAQAPAASGVTVYRCTDSKGQLVALRDSPCRSGLLNPPDCTPVLYESSRRPVVSRSGNCSLSASTGGSSTTALKGSTEEAQFARHAVG